MVKSKSESLKSKEIKITRRIMVKFQQEYAEQEYQEYINS